MACILCSSLALAVLLACLLTLAPLGHIPFVPFAPGLGGCGEVKGQPSWSLPLNMALFSVLRIEKPQWVQAVLQVATYNHTAGGGGVGCAVCLLGFPVQLLVTDPSPPLPSAAGYGVKHCEPSVLPLCPPPPPHIHSLLWPSRRGKRQTPAAGAKARLGQGQTKGQSSGAGREVKSTKRAAAVKGPEIVVRAGVEQGGPELARGQSMGRRAGV